MIFNKLIPELSVACVQKSLEFYAGILGFTVEYSRPEKGFYFLSLEGSQIMVEEVNDHWWTGELEHPFGRGVNFQIEVGDVSVLVERLDEAGIALFRPVGERWYRGGDAEFGQIEFLVQDPDGYLLRFTQDIGERKRRE
jgi:catechol 2,3-dioxygenase-like lactoylglutathione lyase family enzyme